MGLLRRGFGCLFQLGIFALIAGALAAGWAYREEVLLHPGEHIARDHILSIISQESPVYYRDGSTRLGVFFDEEHRQYVPFDEIPPDFVRALVAAEDQNFWKHHGFSIRGISRAMLQNAKAGRTVAGGSTLTQQTAKNLFKRKDRSLEEKLRELLNAWRLEAHFSKEDILEFYSNQFYVNGNGRGLGIAARWFFDKDVADLSLHECAFLAGVVKGPERYNPFVPDEGAQGRARERARIRTGYVLDRMLALGAIDEAAWNTLKGADVPFRRGRFRYERSVVLDEVERELGRAEIRAALAAAGVDDPGRAGISIITTIDQEIQDAALYGLRHHLTEVGTLLDGPALDALFLAEADARPLDSELEKEHSFHAGTIVGADPEARIVRVDLGGKAAEVDAEANGRLAQVRMRAKGKNLWATARRQDVSAFVAEVGSNIGKVALFSVRSRGADGVVRLDWEWSSELQGAVVVLDEGDVRAMVGGTRNADFNRAVAARRQFGSTWKPVVYQAALQLGWRATDRLWNGREVFPYQQTWYFPRPDHEEREQDPTMAMASARSENLASVWLLYHLLDKLDAVQIRTVAGRAGLLPAAGQSRQEWVAQIQGAGVLPTESKREAGIWEELRPEIVAQIDAAGAAEEAVLVSQLPWGNGFADEEARLPKDKQLDKKERAVRKAILRRNVQRLAALSTAYDAALAAVRQAEAEGRPPTDIELAGFFVADDGRFWFHDGPIDGARPMVPGDLAAVSADLAPEQWLDPPAVRLGPERVWLQGQLTPRWLGHILGVVSARREAAGPDLWAWDELIRIRDFRTLVALRYIQVLAWESGVRSPVSPVLSLPLGSTDLTLVEAALLYQGMWTSGTFAPYRDPLVFSPGGKDVEVSAAAVEAEHKEHPPYRLIQSIRDKDGTPIYGSGVRRTELQPEVVGIQMAALLRAVVTHGTGSKAEGAVRPTSADVDRAALWEERGAWVPLFGKTGTTNSYRNAAFVGAVPAVVEGQLQVGKGPVIAAYVGYDDNKEMKRGGIRLMGASASLPIWLATAQGVVNAERHGDRLDPSVADSGAALPLTGWTPADRPTLGPDPVPGTAPEDKAEPSAAATPSGEPEDGPTPSAGDATPVEPFPNEVPADPALGADDTDTADAAEPAGPFVPALPPVFAPVGKDATQAGAGLSPRVPFPELGPSLPPPEPMAEPTPEAPQATEDAPPVESDESTPAEPAADGSQLDSATGSPPPNPAEDLAAPPLP